MRVWISKERVWWYEGSEDKPSASFFSTFENRMESNNNIRVRFINYNEVELVSPTDDITYVKVEHNNKVYYYYVTGINLIANNSYNLTLLLDVYTTYTIPFLNELNTSQTPVKAIRHLDKQFNRLYLEDDLLNAIPKTYESFHLVSSHFNAGSRSGVSVWHVNQYTNLAFERQKLNYNPCVYFVFSNLLDNGDTEYGYVFIPLLTTWPAIKCFTLPNSSGSDCYNNLTSIKRLTSKFANNFRGVVIAPNALSFDDYGKIRNFNGLDYFILDLSDWPMNINVKYLWSGTLAPVNELKPYSKSVCDEIVFKYFNCKYLGGSIAMELLNESGGYFNIDKALYTYTGGSGVIQLNNDKLSYEANLIQLNYQLPSSKDDYDAYVQSSYASANAGYQIAKQNMILNGVKSVIGGISGAASSILGVTKYNNAYGYSGIAGSVTGTALNLASSHLSLSQKRKMMQAQYQDARNTYTNNITMSNIESIKYNRDLFREGCFNALEISKLSEETLQQINYTLYYYGYFEPRLFLLNDLMSFKRDNSFTYFVLEEENLTPKIALYGNTPKEYYEYIIDMLCGGVRIWDKTPTFSN